MSEVSFLRSWGQTAASAHTPRHPFLRRFRANPWKVRVSIQKKTLEGVQGWGVRVASYGDSSVQVYTETWGENPEATVEKALIQAEALGIKGLDLECEWTYPHPHLEPAWK